MWGRKKGREEGVACDRVKVKGIEKGRNGNEEGREGRKKKWRKVCGR